MYLDNIYQWKLSNGLSIWEFDKSVSKNYKGLHFGIVKTTKYEVIQLLEFMLSNEIKFGVKKTIALNSTDLLKEVRKKKLYFSKLVLIKEKQFCIEVVNDVLLLRLSIPSIRLALGYIKNIEPRQEQTVSCSFEEFEYDRLFLWHG